MKTGSSLLQLMFLSIAAVVVLATAPFVGMQFISPRHLFAGDLQATILLTLRIPRVLVAFSAGSGLALCGMMFQAMFRNPLADPFTLGISSGASCGAATTILLGMSGAVAGVPYISLGAFLGAAASMACVYVLSSLQRASTNLTMLLAGIAISFLFSSMLMFMQYMSSLRDSFHIVRWLMGGIEVFGYQPFLSMAPFLGLGTAILAVKLPELDHLLVGDDLAKTRGVRVNRTKNLLLFAATLMVGSIVAVCGPIGACGSPGERPRAKVVRPSIFVVLGRSHAGGPLDPVGQASSLFAALPGPLVDLRGAGRRLDSRQGDVVARLGSQSVGQPRHDGHPRWHCHWHPGIEGADCRFGASRRRS